MINVLLLFTPCLLGMVFGAPLVAGELENYTNRLAWTQGKSRTKWIIVKWCVVGLSLVTVIALLTLIVQWWTGHAAERLSTSLMAALRLGGGGRLQPLYFPITGLALSAYTLFAFALGTALGAAIRKTSWAIAGTVVIYTAVSVVAVLFIRPSLAPQLFVQFEPIAASVNKTNPQELRGAWYLGIGYRYDPGTHESGPSAAAVAQRCQTQELQRTAVSGVPFKSPCSVGDLLPNRKPLLGIAVERICSSLTHFGCVAWSDGVVGTPMDGLRKRSAIADITVFRWASKVHCSGRFPARRVCPQAERTMGRTQPGWRS